VLEELTLEELIQALATVDKELERRGLGAKANPYIPHTPHAKQAIFLADRAPEALYGGAAGGGKSDALLMAALQYIHIPNYSALLLRRTYSDLALPGAILDRAHAWLQGKDAHWNDRDKRWTFPSGATLTFGFLDSEKDKYRYASAEFQYIGFDELTQFPEAWYRFLLSRLRRLEGMQIPIRARAASNPGGIGHDWVKRRFVDSHDPSISFVPATLADNPSIDRDAYERQLQLLDPMTRAQLLEGKWVRNDGGLVYNFSEEKNLCQVHHRWKPDFTILGVDFGYTDATAIVILGWKSGSKDVYVLESVKERGLTPGDAAALIKTYDTEYEFSQMVADIGGLGKGYAEEARQRFGLPLQAAEKRNKRGYIDLMNGDFASGRLKIHGPRNKDLIAELVELPWSEDRKKEAEGFDNHLCDALLYAWRASRAHGEVEPEETVKIGFAAQMEAEEERSIHEEVARATRPWWDPL
jgi:hypothetical protein